MTMKSFFLAIGLTSLAALTLYAADKDQPKDVEMKGVLHTGIVAVGGETTGVLIETKDGRYELDLGADKELRDKADKLDGKSATVTGQWTVRKGVERPDRKVLVVTTLKADEEK
jgi:hypothetical protein